MKRTTLLLENGIYTSLVEKAKKDRKTLKDIVNQALRLFLNYKPKEGKNNFKIRLHKVDPIANLDLSNRESLYDLFDKFKKSS